jgi:hypothetical protein
MSSLYTRLDRLEARRPKGPSLAEMDAQRIWLTEMIWDAVHGTLVVPENPAPIAPENQAAVDALTAYLDRFRAADEHWAARINRDTTDEPHALFGGHPHAHA